MRDGKIVQAGSPDELYDSPKDLFAMRFLGDATALPTPSGEPVYLRPHDLRVEAFPFSGSHAGSVRRAARRGSLLRLDVTLFSGHDVIADIPTASLSALSSAVGTTVHLAPLASITFLPAQEARVS
jgi:ABC-type sulfate/molybdate transport systems ATPase subunit